MLIQIVYTDNTHDYVKDFQLDKFLEMGKIAKFRRRSGWAVVGVDQIRTQKQKSYNGVERRNRGAL